MGVTINRYPTSGGTVTYWIEQTSGLYRIHFDVTVNSGHTLTYYSYSNSGGASTGGSKSIVGPSTRTDFYVQSYDHQTVTSHVFSVCFDGAQPGHEDEYYELDVIVTQNIAAAGAATATPDHFEEVPVGTVSRYTLQATPNPGYIFDHWERIQDGETVETSTSNPRTINFTASSEGYYQRIYVAYFRELQTYTLTASASPSEGGTVNGVDVYTENFEEGTTASVTLSAVPSEGYAFVKWTRTSPSTATLRNATITRSVSRSETWVAEFTNDPGRILNLVVKFHPDSNDHGIHGTVRIENEQLGVDVTEDNTVAIPLSSESLTSSHVAIYVTAHPNDGYRFVKATVPVYSYVIVTADSRKRITPPVSNPRLDVYWGCDKLMYLKDNDKLVHATNGKLIYCG